MAKAKSDVLVITLAGLIWIHVGLAVFMGLTYWLLCVIPN